jgi:deoxycytidylate deaminase
MSLKEMLEQGLDQATCRKHPLTVVVKGINPQTNQKDYVLGWNGPDDVHECVRKGLDSGKYNNKMICRTIHAEPRAIWRAQDQGYDLRNGTIYMKEWFPCANCAQHIVDAGIKKLVTPDQVYDDKAKHLLVKKLRNVPVYDFEGAERILVEKGVKIIIDSTLKT